MNISKQMRILFIIIFLLFGQSTFAWNAAGHQLSATIGWNLMSKEQQDYWVDILKHHPRFAKDFKDNIPQFIKFNPENYNEWIFRQASTWPDLARGFNGSIKEKYHHGGWHYINYPLYLNKPINTDFLNLQTEFTGELNNELNIIQALKGNLLILSKPGATKSEKAIALCWVLHLIGDAHQPLHSTALFSPILFPKGDRGGNLIKIRGQGQIENLHWYWDSRLNETTSFKIIDLKAKKLLANHNEVKQSIDVKGILENSNSLAKKVVYTPVLLDLLGKMENQNVLQKIFISNTYDKQARATAEKQILKAGYFISQTLSEIKQ